MNDNDIIKALRQCAAGGSCRHCPLEEEVGCRRKVLAYAKAEIERLKNENAKLRHEMSYMKKPDTIGDIHEMGAW